MTDNTTSSEQSYMHQFSALALVVLLYALNYIVCCDFVSMFVAKDCCI